MSYFQTLKIYVGSDKMNDDPVNKRNKPQYYAIQSRREMFANANNPCTYHEHAGKDLMKKTPTPAEMVMNL